MNDIILMCLSPGFFSSKYHRYLIFSAFFIVCFIFFVLPRASKLHKLGRVNKKYKITRCSESIGGQHSVVKNVFLTFPSMDGCLFSINIHYIQLRCRSYCRSKIHQLSGDHNLGPIDIL